jgi:hypothetical protein
VDDIIGAGTIEGEMNDGFHGHVLESESLRETHEQIEHWTADNISPSSLDQELLMEEVYICYGTVSFNAMGAVCPICLKVL